MFGRYLDICYGTKTPVIRQLSVKQASDAAKGNGRSTWREIIDRYDAENSKDGSGAVQIASMR